MLRAGPGMYEIKGHFGNSSLVHTHGPSYSIGGQKTKKGVISKDHQRVRHTPLRVTASCLRTPLLCLFAQEMFGTQSPGVGVYSPKIDLLKSRFPTFNMSSSVKEDLYRYNKEISKSPGPIYNFKVINDLSSPLSGVSSLCFLHCSMKPIMREGRRFLPEKIEHKPAPGDY